MHNTFCRCNLIFLKKQNQNTYRQIRSGYDTVSQKVVNEKLLNPESCILTKRFYIYSKTCVKRSLKNRQNKGLSDKWLLDECRKYCRMLPLEQSAILLTCIKRLLVLKTIFLSFREWPFYTLRFSVYG